MKIRLSLVLMLTVAGCSYHIPDSNSNVFGRQDSVAVDNVVADGEINRRLESYSNCVKSLSGAAPASTIYFQKEGGSNLELSSQGGIYGTALKMTKGTQFTINLEKSSLRSPPVKYDFRVVTSEVIPEVIEDASIAGSLLMLVGWGQFEQYKLMRLEMVSVITNNAGKLMRYQADKAYFLKKEVGSNYDIPARINGRNMTIGVSMSNGDYSVELHAYRLLNKVHAAKVVASIIAPQSNNVCSLNLVEDGLINSAKSCSYKNYINVCGNEWADWYSYASRGVNSLVFSAFVGKHSEEVSVKEISVMDMGYFASGGCYMYMLEGSGARNLNYHLAPERVGLVGLAKSVDIKSCAIKYPEKFSRRYSEKFGSDEFVLKAMREIIRGQ